MLDHVGKNNNVKGAEFLCRPGLRDVQHIGLRQIGDHLRKIIFIDVDPDNRAPLQLLKSRAEVSRCTPDVEHTGTLRDLAVHVSPAVGGHFGREKMLGATGQNASSSLGAQNRVSSALM
jgi:hypothetical protein